MTVSAPASPLPEATAARVMVQSRAGVLILTGPAVVHTEGLVRGLLHTEAVALSGHIPALMKGALVLLRIPNRSARLPARPALDLDLLPHKARIVGAGLLQWSRGCWAGSGGLFSQQVGCGDGFLTCCLGLG